MPVIKKKVNLTYILKETMLLRWTHIKKNNRTFRKFQIHVYQLIIYRQWNDNTDRFNENSSTLYNELWLLTQSIYKLHHWRKCVSLASLAKLSEETFELKQKLIHFVGVHQDFIKVCLISVLLLSQQQNEPDNIKFETDTTVNTAH